MRFDLFSSGRLYKALEEAGYPDLPRPRTLQDWISNDSAPEGARQFVARNLLGITKDAPPSGESGALEWLVERWNSAEPPKWAAGQFDALMAAVTDLRSQSLEEGARQAVRAAGAELRRQIRGGLALTNGEPQRSTSAKRAKRRSSASG